MGDMFVALLGSSVGAAAVTGAFMLIKWGLERKAQKEDRADAQQVTDCAARGEQIGAVVIACRVLLYDRIKHLGKTYIARGNITAEELEDLIAMHECYHTTLGGNGFLDDVMAQVRRLPIK